MTEEQIKEDIKALLKFHKVECAERNCPLPDRIVQLIQHEKEDARREEQNRITRWIAERKEELKGYGFTLTVDDKGMLVAVKDDGLEPGKGKE